MKLDQLFMVFERLQIPVEVQQVTIQDCPIGEVRRGLIAGVSLVAGRGILLKVAFKGREDEQRWFRRRNITLGVWHEAVLLEGTSGWGDLGETRYNIQGLDFACVDVRLF